MKYSSSFNHPLTRSLEKIAEKENQGPTTNLYDNKNKFRTNISNVSSYADKLTVQRYSSQLSIKKKSSYKINELQNINLVALYHKNYLAQIKITPHCGFLSRHDVTCLYRAKMVDWMMEVMSSYKCSDRTLFKAIELMDLYYIKSPRIQKSQNLHLVGVTSILIANKMQEIYPIKMKVIHDKIAHKKLSMQEITFKQAQFFELLDYNLNVQSLLDCVEIILASFCIQNEYHSQLQKIATYVAKAVIYQYSLLCSFSKEIISAAIVEIAIRKAEDLIKNFNGTPYLNLIKKHSKHNRSNVKECAENIEKLVKNFDVVYPNLHNFKKFNKVIVEGRNIRNIF